MTLKGLSVKYMEELLILYTVHEMRAGDLTEQSTGEIPTTGHLLRYW